MKAPLGVVLFLPLVSVATACVTTGGTAPAGSACVFPFTYAGISYSTCTNHDNGATMWCYTDSDGTNPKHVSELVPCEGEGQRERDSVSR